MISILLLLLAGIANAFMDILKNQWNNSKWQKLSITNYWYRFAGPEAWKNKWKKGTTDIPRFFLSSTALVFLTDAWHFFQMLWRLSFTFAIVFYHPMVNWWADFIFLSIAYLVAFNLFYEKILRK